MLVSCVMPTFNRGKFIRAAVDCFLKQDYPEKELIILDDSTEPDTLELSSAWPVSHVFVDRKTTGMKRNLCCELAKGDIICHFDTDDWSAPDRISDQVNRLKQSGKPITGYSTMLFWDTLTGQAKRYVAHSSGYVLGTSFCYLREFWKKRPFKDEQKSTDNGFIDRRLQQVAASQDSRFMVARIHANHTSGKAGIREIVPRETIPAGFWENEQMRLAC
jgi:glycosyltransferase involved in cell wall biosynthesis